MSICIVFIVLRFSGVIDLAICAVGLCINIEYTLYIYVYLLPDFLKLFLWTEIWSFSAENYLKHPNCYLPKYNVQTETDGETAPLTGINKNTLDGLDIGPHQQIFESDDDDDQGIPSYGFPQQRRNRREPYDVNMLNGGTLNFILFQLDLCYLINYAITV